MSGQDIVRFYIRINGANIDNIVSDAIKSKNGWNFNNISNTIIGNSGEKRYINVSKYAMSGPLPMGYQQSS